jgi:hypothetical protein
MFFMTRLPMGIQTGIVMRFYAFELQARLAWRLHSKRLFESPRFAD